MAKKVIVIGGGFGGLATAALLGKDGYQVTLVEKNSILGGRARYFEKNGFRFDMGPSWYLMPEVFEQYFGLFGEKTTDYYRLVKPKPQYRVFFENQNHIDIQADFKANQKTFESIEPGAGKKLKDYLELTGRLYRLINRDLLFQRYRSADLIKLLTIVNPLISYHRLVSRFFKDHRLQKILEFPTVFLGGSPYQTPAVYSLLNYADLENKVWYPIGGMYRVIAGLEKLALKNKVKIIRGQEVKKIKATKNQVSGVFINDQLLPADYVVASADMAHAEIDLLEPQYQSYPVKYWQKKTLAISAMLLYLGINGQVKNLVHHSLYFCHDWQKNFNQIFKDKVLPDNPSLYLSVRTKTDPAIAPKGKEEIFVLVPIASGLQLKKKQATEYADKIIDMIENISQDKIKSKLLIKEIYGPTELSRDYNAYQGTALGLAHTLGQSVIFRPANCSRKVKNLFYVGQFTQPGVGMPMCLISAQIVNQMINRHESKTKFQANF